MGALLHSRVQKRAQEEIDSVIGNDRLPLLSDRPNLPYLDAVAKEALRWNSVVPMGEYGLCSDNIKLYNFCAFQVCPMFLQRTTLSMSTSYRKARSSCLIFGASLIRFCFLPSNESVLRYMCHDPNVYHDPFEFKPERFLGVDGRAPEPDPSNLAFGFGRR